MRASTLGVLAHADARLIWRDPLLKWLLLLPIGLALLVRVLILKTHDALLVSAGLRRPRTTRW